MNGCWKAINLQSRSIQKWFTGSGPNKRVISLHTFFSPYRPSNVSRVQHRKRPQWKVSIFLIAVINDPSAKKLPVFFFHPRLRLENWFIFQSAYFSASNDFNAHDKLFVIHKQNTNFIKSCFFFVETDPHRCTEQLSARLTMTLHRALFEREKSFTKQTSLASHVHSQWTLLSR